MQVRGHTGAGASAGAMGTAVATVWEFDARPPSIAGDRDRHRVLIEVAVLEGRGDGRGKEVGRTSRAGRPSECAGEGVSLTDGYLVGAAHRVLNLPRLEGGGGCSGIEGGQKADRIDRAAKC